MSVRKTRLITIPRFDEDYLKWRYTQEIVHCITAYILNPHHDWAYERGRFLERLAELVPFGDGRTVVLDLEHDGMTPDLAQQIVRDARMIRPLNLYAVDGKPNPNWGTGGRSAADLKWDDALVEAGAISWPMYMNGRAPKTGTELIERAMTQLQRIQKSSHIAQFERTVWIWHVRNDNPDNTHDLLDMAVYRELVWLHAGLVDRIVLFRNPGDSWDVHYDDYVANARSVMHDRLTAYQAATLI